MKTIFILSDTVNRRALSIYGSKNPAITPNLERLASRGTVFNNHWCGSAPCMPARRDILTGRLGFLERPWGGIEPFDQTLPHILKHNNVHTQLFTDHSQYLIAGGENYLHGFTAWDVTRGQEFDPWAVTPDKNGIRKDNRPDNYKGTYSEIYMANRERVKCEADYPSVITLTKAAEWLKANKDADNFMLWVETFDPHEPFEMARKYFDMYQDDYKDDTLFWPVYERNPFSPEETRHLNTRYKALLTMTDHYIGELFRVMDENNMWQDTMVIFTTDHGYMLGEHEYMAKNYMPAFNEVFHIPLIIYHPDAQPKRVDGLTQNIDILPTVMEYFGVNERVLQNKLHGKSILPLISGEKDKIRDGIIYGYFGKSVNYTDGRYTYLRAAKTKENRPLYVYAAMPTILRQQLGSDSISPEDYTKIEMGRFLPYTKYPVYRFPADIIKFSNPSQEFMTRSDYNKDNLLFDLSTDYQQENPIKDEALENLYIQKLKACMRKHDSPAEQFERLGI